MTLASFLGVTLVASASLVAATLPQRSVGLGIRPMDWTEEAADDDLDSTAIEDEAVEVLGLEVVDSLEYSGYVEGAEHHHFRPISDLPEATTTRAVIRSCGSPSLNVPRLVALHSFMDKQGSLFTGLTLDSGCAKAQGGDWFPAAPQVAPKTRPDEAVAIFYNLHGKEMGRADIAGGLSEAGIAAKLEQHGLRRRALGSEARGAEEEMSVRGIITTEADETIGMSLDDDFFDGADLIDYSDSASPLDH
jgi:hypothetical protein